MRTVLDPFPPVLAWWLVANKKRDYFGIDYDLPPFFVLATNAEHAEMVACVILDMGPADFRRHGTTTFHGNEKPEAIDTDPTPEGLARPAYQNPNAGPITANLANLD